HSDGAHRRAELRPARGDDPRRAGVHDFSPVVATDDEPAPRRPPWDVADGPRRRADARLARRDGPLRRGGTAVPVCDGGNRPAVRGRLLSALAAGGEGVRRLLPRPARPPPSDRGDGTVLGLARRASKGEPHPLLARRAGRFSGGTGTPWS